MVGLGAGTSVLPNSMSDSANEGSCVYVVVGLSALRIRDTMGLGVIAGSRIPLWMSETTGFAGAGEEAGVLMPLWTSESSGATGVGSFTVGSLRADWISDTTGLNART